METITEEFLERKNISARAVLGDRFFINLGTISGSDVCKKFRKDIRLRQHVIQNCVSCRVMNHWEAQDLIECERNNDSGWRKFSIIEYVWLRIVHKLRELGLPLAKIAKIKPFYFERENGTDKTTFVTYYLTAIRLFKQPVYFVILLDEGQAEFLDYHEFHAALEFLGSYICINLNELLNTIFVKKIEPIYPIFAPVSKNLNEALDLLENEEYDTATIYRKGKLIQKVELDKHFDKNTPDDEILDDHENTDFIKKKRKGVVISKKRKVIKELSL